MSLRPRPLIEELASYAPPPEGRHGKLRLDFCEWPGEVPPSVLAALQKVTSEHLAAYPEVEAFSHKLAKFLGLPGADHLLTFNGSDEAISVAVRTFLEPGERAVVVKPTFSMIPLLLAQHGVETVEVPLERAAAQGGPVFAFDFEGLSEALDADDGAKALIVPSPNNPTGTWAEPMYWLDLARRFPDRLILIDEAYAEFAPVRMHAYAAYEYPNVIVTGTFSKALGLAGLRLGWASGNAATLAHLAKLRLPYTVNAVAVHVAEAMMREAYVIDDRVIETHDGLRHLEAGLRDRGIPASRGYGNALLAWLGIDAPWMAAWLERHGILVRNLGSKPMLEGALRITGASLEMVERVLNTIGDGLAGRAFVVADPRRTMLATALRNSVLGRRYRIVPPTGTRQLLKPRNEAASSSASGVSLSAFAPQDNRFGDDLAPPSMIPEGEASNANANGAPHYSSSSTSGRGSGRSKQPHAEVAGHGYWLSSRPKDIAAATAFGYHAIGLVERESPETLKQAGAIATIPAQHGEHGVADIVDQLLRLFAFHAPLNSVTGSETWGKRVASC